LLKIEASEKEIISNIILEKRLIFLKKLKVKTVTIHDQ